MVQDIAEKSSRWQLLQADVLAAVQQVVQATAQIAVQPICTASFAASCAVSSEHL